jgi:hypothetical protein
VLIWSLELWLLPPKQKLGTNLQDVTSIAVFPSKVGGNESITHLSWRWMEQAPSRVVEIAKFVPKLAGLRMTLGNLWLTTQQVSSFPFPLSCEL